MLGRRLEDPEANEQVSPIFTGISGAHKIINIVSWFAQSSFFGSIQIKCMEIRIVQSIENLNALSASLLLHILHLHIQSLQLVHACFERVNVTIGLA
jgi:hypothetical protein